MTALTTTETDRAPTIFDDLSVFEAAQRMARALSESTIVPPAYQGNIANCLVGLSVARRLGLDPLAVLSNLHIIQGRPQLSATLLIALVQSSGILDGPLEWIDQDGEPVGHEPVDGMACRAMAWSGKYVVGPLVTLDMARDEGWLARSGSKWRTMPQLMLRYRAAAFWARLYAPGLALGLMVDEESDDAGPQPRPGQRDVLEIRRVPEAAQVGIERVAHDRTTPEGLEPDDLGIEAPEPMAAPTLARDDEGWPRPFGDSWIDSAGTQWDPSLHATGRDGAPSVTKAGVFRKRRADAGTGPGPATPPPAGREVEPDNDDAPNVADPDPVSAESTTADTVDTDDTLDAPIADPLPPLEWDEPVDERTRIRDVIDAAHDLASIAEARRQIAMAAMRLPADAVRELQDRADDVHATLAAAYRDEATESNPVVGVMIGKVSGETEDGERVRRLEGLLARIRESETSADVRKWQLHQYRDGLRRRQVDALGDAAEHRVREIERAASGTPER